MRARTRDRRVYLSGHPVLFALLAAVRRRPVTRLGGTLLVNGTDEFIEAMTRLPLDRQAEGTTGAIARDLADADLLFDQEGAAHRTTRRDLAARLSSTGVERLRPVWLAVLDRHLVTLRRGGEIDLVALTAELAGSTAAALLGIEADPRALSTAARDAAAAAARAHLPGPRLPHRRGHDPAITAARLTTLLASAPRIPAPLLDGPAAGCPVTGRAGQEAATSTPSAPGCPVIADSGSSTAVAAGQEAAPGTANSPLPGTTGSHSEARRRGRPATETGPEMGAGLAAMLAVAAINTTVAAIPRAVAWCADDGLWDHAATGGERLDALVTELLRVIVPTPLLPRAAAADGTVGGCPVAHGDRLVLVTRHATGAHRDDPDPAAPAPPHVAQLVFGTGPHACPGAGLARAQLRDVLAALAPFRPVVVAARPDRAAALPGWRTLRIRPTIGQTGGAGS
ncbi:cytochrome P450 [Catenuloplanes japonicus]|uniref:cytochrome P450 n=1 Tax=Catenuloplanes japonicus TaxID=33876 RepID=UPI000523F8BA|nr:cytochrome P450 [Catenuloplanes japonicus]